MATDNEMTHHVDAKRGLSNSDISTLVLVGVVVLFAIVNSRSTKISWIFASSKAPLFVVIAICMVVGFAAGFLFAQRRGKHD